MNQLTIWSLQSHEQGHKSSFWLGLNQCSVCTVFCLHRVSTPMALCSRESLMN